jgi:hypothetical protein
MTRQRWGAIVGLAVLLGACAAGVLAPAADGAKKEKKADPCDIVGEPGGTPEAAGTALSQPDEYAWQLFLFLNRQAKAGCAGVADPTKKDLKDYDPDTDVVWESWALASSADSEVFLADAAKPVPWDRLGAGKRPAPAAKLDINLLLATQRLLALGPAELRSDKTLRELLVVSPADGFEVRVNRATFETVRDNGWYSKAGLVKAYQQAQATNNPDFIQFPPMAKAIKAAWRPIDDPGQKDRYHWRTVNGKPYRLMALHVITKDLPLWFWCDFIHADLDPSEPVPSRDTTTRGPGALHGKNGVRDETVGSKWANYRLKGSQVAFTDARGQPTKLGNQMLEGFNNVKLSSCITCHATARIDDKGVKQSNTFFLGVPPPGTFATPAGVPLLQTDFLWSLPFRAGAPAAGAPAPAAPAREGPR